MTATGRSTAAALMLLCALVLALVVALAVPAFLSWTKDGRSIRADRARIASIEASQTTFIRVKHATDGWELFARSPAAGFLDATSLDEAVAVARTHVETVLARHGGELSGIGFEPGETRRAQVETVRMDLAVTLPKAALAAFLADLEDTPPYTLVTAFRATEEDEARTALVLGGRMQWLAEAGP